MIQSFRWMWALLSPSERLRFISMLGLTFIMAIFELVTVAGILPFLSVLANPSLIETEPALIWFANIFGLEGAREVSLGLGVAVFVLVVVGMAVRALVTYAQLRFALMRSYSLASRLLHRHLGQDYAFYLGRNTASLSQSLLSEVDKVVRESLMPTVMLISNATILAMIGGFLFYANPSVAFGALSLLVGVYLISFLLLRNLIRRIGKLRLKANRVRFGVVQEVTGSLKEIKVMGLERASMTRFRDPALKMAEYQTVGMVMQRMPRFALETMVYGGFVGMVLFLIVIRGGEIADLLPILGLLAISATKLFPALQQLYSNFSSLTLSYPALERLYNDMQTEKPLPLLPPSEGPTLPLTKTLALKDVVYCYPQAEAPSLNKLSLEFPANGTVGIVGGTGAGKTTVVDLLLGLLYPDAGHVAVDGTPLTRATVPDWQRNIGYVPQAIFLSDDTVAANIGFGLPRDQIDMERVERAARMASLHDFVQSELPEKYMTKVGERGVRLSGGQRQRIGIARALYRNPSVLVLDEATSALDNLTERAVMDEVRALGGEKTIIMIAHRLTTVEHCDKIMLLERGTLLAEGTYSELVAGNETFRRMANANT